METGSEVSAASTVKIAQGQTTDLFDVEYPYPPYNDHTDAGAGAVTIPASASSEFIFAVHSTTAPSAGLAQPLQAYSRGFPSVDCNVNGIQNISFAQLYTPEGTRDYAVHLSSRVPYPNNVTGTFQPRALLSTSTQQHHTF